MKRRVCWQMGIAYGVIFLLIVNPSRLAQAGWSGAMNGLGVGFTSVNVTSSALIPNTVSAPGPTNPNLSTSIPYAGYFYNGDLPSGSSHKTAAQSKGLPGYIWQNLTQGYNGDSTDNTNIENRVSITPADCAILEMDSTSALSPDGVSGSITVNALATAGTGLLLRGFEYDPSLLPPTTIDDLVAHGSLKFDILLVGPFDLNTSNCTAVVIPFTTKTGNTNLYFVTDGVAKSNPLIVTCSANPVVIGCADPVRYPAPQISGGCGAVQYTFNPTPANLPLGVVSTVTVTAFDEAGNTNSCTFKVDTTAKAFTVTYPANVFLGCDSAPVYPSPQISGGCGTFSYSYTPAASALVPGVPTTVTATVTDVANNISVMSQFTATRLPLTFNGFDSPIGGIGGSCSSPLRTISGGSVIPVKFTDFCNGSPLFTGTPTLSIKDCAGHFVAGGNFQIVANEWHFNWDTTGLSTKPGKVIVYQLIVTLQDGSTQTVFVGLK